RSPTPEERVDLKRRLRQTGPAQLGDRILQDAQLLRGGVPSGDDVVEQELEVRCCDRRISTALGRNGVHNGQKRAQVFATCFGEVVEVRAVLRHRLAKVEQPVLD